WIAGVTIFTTIAGDVASAAVPRFLRIPANSRSWCSEEGLTVVCFWFSPTPTGAALVHIGPSSTWTVAFPENSPEAVTEFVMRWSSSENTISPTWEAEQYNTTLPPWEQRHRPDRYSRAALPRDSPSIPASLSAV